MSVVIVADDFSSCIGCDGSIWYLTVQSQLPAIFAIIACCGPGVAAFIIFSVIACCSADGFEASSAMATEQASIVMTDSANNLFIGTLHVRGGRDGAHQRIVACVGRRAGVGTRTLT